MVLGLSFLKVMLATTKGFLRKHSNLNCGRPGLYANIVQ